MVKPPSNKMNRIKRGCILWDISVYILATFAALTTVYPFIYIFSMSISDPANVLKMNVWLYPKGFSLDAYKVIVNNNIMWRASLNSIIYASGAAFLNIITSSTAGYVLSRKKW